MKIREPEWFEYRMLKGPDTNVNLHVFSENCDEVNRMIVFRDWLRNNDDERQLYAEGKVRLAQQKWKYIQDYADAKTKVIHEIIARVSGEI